MLVLLCCLSPLISIGVREESGPFILRRKSLKSELSSGTGNQCSTEKTTASLNQFLEVPEGVIPLRSSLPRALLHNFFWKMEVFIFTEHEILTCFSQVSVSSNHPLLPNCYCRGSVFFKLKWELQSALLLCNSNGTWPIVLCHWKIYAFSWKDAFFLSLVSLPRHFEVWEMIQQMLSWKLEDI